jgi:hypothetical protein
MTAAPVMSITEELVAELERELAWSDKRSAEILAALLAERAELKRDAGVMRKALVHLSQGVSCGCSFPCGCCENVESLVIELEGRIELASEALAAMQAAQ